MIPVKLSIQNFLSHDKSDVDFGRFNVALILGSFNNNSDQSNGAGKSAIFEAIFWALFGKSRHKKKDGVVKKDKKLCKVEFVFDVDGTQYRITRMRDKTVGESDVVFEQWTGTDWKNISCDTNTATDDRICTVINLNSEVFLNSVYFKQNDISMFAEAKPSERKDILKALLKMDKWDEFQKSAREHARILSAKSQDKTKNVVSLATIEENIVSCKSDIQNIKLELERVNTEYTNLNDVLVGKKSRHQTILNDLQNAPELLQKVQREANEAKKRVSYITTKVKENDSVISQSTDNIALIQQKIKVLNEKIKAGANINLQEINSKLIAGKAREKSLKEHILHLEKDVSLDKECPTCRKELTKTDIRGIKETRDKELVDIRAKYDEIKAKLVKADQRAKEMELALSEANRAEIDKGKIELKIAKCKSAVDACIHENTSLRQELKTLQSRDFNKEINDLRARVDKEEYNKLEKEIEDMSRLVKDLRDKSNKLNVSYGSKVNILEDLTKQEKEQKELQEELSKLNSDYAIYDKLRHYFGKDGIQAVILENVIEELETYANDILSKICNEPTTAAIKTQKQGDNGSWMETFDIEVASGGRTDEFETYSGGEQFRISLALRLALSKILSQRIGGNVKFLLLDEVSSSLDDKGLEMFINIVKQLGNEMKILVITHDEKLKEQFDDVIIVNKTVDGSKIIQ